MNTNQFKKYKRGEIIYIDLGKGIGQEFSFKHFALVISKKDSKYNEKLIVIPLTSKNKQSIKIDIDILYHYLESYKQLIKSVKVELAEVKDRINSLKKGDIMTLLELDSQTNILLNKMANYQQIQSKITNLINKSSFAKYKDITTISKKRIMPYIEDLDTTIRLSRKETNRIVSYTTSFILD